MSGCGAGSAAAERSEAPAQAVPGPPGRVRPQLLPSGQQQQQQPPAAG